MSKSDLAVNCELRRLHDICEINPENLIISEYKEDFIEYIDISSINNETFLISEIRKIPIDEIPSRARRIIRENDVIISTVRPYLQAFTKISEKDDGKICSTGFAVLRTKGEVYFDYLYHWVFSSKFMHFMISNMVGSNYPAVNMSDVKFAPIILPPYDEQIQIAKILTNVDNLIQATQRLIEKLQECKKGLMQRLFTEGIEHTEFKESRLGKIPESWDIVKLEKIVDIFDSQRIPLSQAERSKRKGKYPYCGANSIIDYIDDYIFDGEFVLLAEDGGAFGRYEQSAYIMKGKFWVNNHAHVIKAVDGKSNNLFLLYCINYLHLIPYTVGSTRVKLNQGDLRNIKIPLPPLEEQIKIGNFLGNIDDKVEYEMIFKKKLNDVKKGLMQVLLTGKKRVVV